MYYNDEDEKCQLPRWSRDEKPQSTPLGVENTLKGKNIYPFVVLSNPPSLPYNTIVSEKETTTSGGEKVSHRLFSSYSNHIAPQPGVGRPPRRVLFFSLKLTKPSHFLILKRKQKEAL